MNLPKLTTLVATEITAMTAKSGGIILSNGDSSPITAKGVVWDISPQPEISLETKTIETTGANSFTSTLNGLTPFTTYYVRAYATTSSGTGYGNQITFRTGPNLPSITTMPIENITATSASSGGMITNNGGSHILSQGLVWSTNPEPTLESPSKITDGTGNANFTSQLTNLHPYTTYYLRAYASNSGGTSYGNELVFTTKTAITTYSRLFDGYILNLGIDLVTTTDGGFVTSKEEIVKLDSLGNLLWKKGIRYNPNVVKSQIVKTQDRGYLIVNDIALHKFDEHGNVQWTDIRADEHNERSQDIGVAAEMEDGTYLVTSLDWENGPALQKLDNNGNLIWTKYPTYMQHTSLITNAENNSAVLVALSGSNRISIVKIDNESNLVWLKEYTHIKAIFDGKIIKCNNGSFILAMKTVGPYDSWSNWIVKLDHSGNLTWEKELKLGNGNQVNDITPVSDGGFVCVGYYYMTPYHPTIAFMLKLDQNGNEVWSFGFKPEQQYYDFLWSFWAVEETNDKGLAVLGSKSFIYNNQAGSGSWLLKTDANGNFNR